MKGDRRGNGSRVYGKVWDASDRANQTASQSDEEEGGPRRAISGEKTALISWCAQHGSKLDIKKGYYGVQKKLHGHALCSPPENNAKLKKAMYTYKRN